MATRQLEVNPRDADVLSYIAQYHAMLGEKQPALDFIGRALRVGSQDPEVDFTAAIVYNQIGDRESSLALLKKAMRGGISVATVRATPNFANLASEARFRALMKLP